MVHCTKNVNQKDAADLQARQITIDGGAPARKSLWVKHASDGS
jgi:hypothetical protein